LTDPAAFKSGRQFAAYLGLVPRQNSWGGKDRLGHFSKMGNGYLCRLLVVGATSVIRRAASNNTRTGVWVRSLLERKPTRLVTVAIANKTALTAWALLVKPNGWFRGGVLRHAGILGFITGHVGDAFTLSCRMPDLEAAIDAPQAQTLVEIAPGCDLLCDTCKAKFGNLLNFGGFPDIPGRNPFWGGSVV
jgi:hypothetical protein